ncbi:hypothetical protein ACTXT7_006565 [Hymenolepis weldensis]
MNPSNAENFTILPIARKRLKSDHSSFLSRMETYEKPSKFLCSKAYLGLSYPKKNLEEDFHQFMAAANQSGHRGSLKFKWASLAEMANSVKFLSVIA